MILVHISRLGFEQDIHLYVVLPHRLSSCPYRERPLHFSLNVFMQIQCAIHLPSTQFTKLLPFESPLLPNQITQFELSILVLHMAIAAFL